MSSETVTLGAHELEVYPQRHAYLMNKVGKFIDGLTNTDSDINDADDLVSFLGDNAYELLAVLFPQYGKRCPAYEFKGYGSQAAMDAGDYNEAEDNSPTFPEIVEAFEVSARVNRLDILKVLGKVVDPKLVKSWINAEMATTLERSVSSRSVQDGVDPSTSSGVKSQTLMESTA